MFLILAAVLPIFAIIFTGWLARRLNVFGEHATRELNRFVVYLALPALLFDIVANVHWSEIWQPGFIVAYAAGAFILFIGTVLVRRRGGVGLADATIDGLNAGYSNTAFLGFPLVSALLGEKALPLPMIATLLTVCLLFAVSIALIEAAKGQGRGAAGIARKAAGAMIVNPLVVAPTLGAVAALSGLVIPAPVEIFLKLLGGTATPCALVALGLFLAQHKTGEPVAMRTLSAFVAVKLLLHPVLTWLIAVPLLGLAPGPARAAVLIAALPTGTGPFMLAEFYGREAGMTSRVILISTILSILTVSAYMTLSAP